MCGLTVGRSPISQWQARVVFADSPGPIDLLIFASASPDLIEPATSRIVASKLSLDCTVMDIKNACNSVLNAMQVADDFVVSGQYQRVLVTSGEQPSHVVRWLLASTELFLRSFLGYIMRDGSRTANPATLTWTDLRCRRPSATSDRMPCSLPCRSSTSTGATSIRRPSSRSRCRTRRRFSTVSKWLTT